MPRACLAGLAALALSGCVARAPEDPPFYDLDAGRFAAPTVPRDMLATFDQDTGPQPVCGQYEVMGLDGTAVHTDGVRRFRLPAGRHRFVVDKDVIEPVIQALEGAGPYGFWIFGLPFEAAACAVQHDDMCLAFDAILTPGHTYTIAAADEETYHIVDAQSGTPVATADILHRRGRDEGKLDCRDGLEPAPAPPDPDAAHAS